MSLSCESQRPGGVGREERAPRTVVEDGYTLTKIKLIPSLPERNGGEQLREGSPAAPAGAHSRGRNGYTVTKIIQRADLGRSWNYFDPEL